jgi:hypothetical protein
VDKGERIEQLLRGDRDSGPRTCDPEEP